MSYYDDERITQDEATDAVERFAQQKHNTRHLVTSKGVCDAMDIAPTEHNRRRVLHALRVRFELSEMWSNSEEKFKVEL